MASVDEPKLSEDSSNRVGTSECVHEEDRRYDLKQKKEGVSTLEYVKEGAVGTASREEETAVEERVRELEEVEHRMKMLSTEHAILAMRMAREMVLGVSDGWLGVFGEAMVHHFQRIRRKACERMCTWNPSEGTSSGATDDVKVPEICGIAPLEGIKVGMRNRGWRGNPMNEDSVRWRCSWWLRDEDYGEILDRGGFNGEWARYRFWEDPGKAQAGLDVVMCTVDRSVADGVRLVLFDSSWKFLLNMREPGAMMTRMIHEV